MANIFDSYTEDADPPKKNIFDDFVDEPKAAAPTPAARNIFDEYKDDPAVANPVDAEKAQREFGAIKFGSGLVNEFEQRTKDAKFFPAMTQALSNAQDKNIRRDPTSGEWDAPRMRLTQEGTGSADFDSDRGFIYNAGAAVTKVGGVVNDALASTANWASGGVSTFVNPVTGARLGDDDTDAQVRKVFDSFQQDNKLSDEQMQAVWSDLGNKHRKWDTSEDIRIQSDGSVEFNPASRGLMNLGEMETKINQSNASDTAKKIAISQLPERQKITADRKVQAYTAASYGLSPRQDFAKFQAAHAGTPLPDIVRKYETEVIDKEGWGDKLSTMVYNDAIVQGGGNLVNVGLGVAGMLGSEAAADKAADFQRRMALVQEGSVQSGLIGDVLKQAPSLAATILFTRGAGAGASALGASEAAAARIATATSYGLAGAQSAGGTYASEYEQALSEGKTKEEAHSEASVKAVRAGVNTALVTAAFGAGEYGGAEQVAVGKPIANLTLKDLAVMAARKDMTLKQLIKSPQLRTVFGDIGKGAVGEFGEEALDQFGQDFINQDPDTNLADAVDNIVRSGLVGMGAGGAAKTLHSAASSSEIFKMMETAKANAPSAAQAAVAETVQNNMDTATEAAPAAPTPPTASVKVSPANVAPAPTDVAPAPTDVAPAPTDVLPTAQIEADPFEVTTPPTAPVEAGPVDVAPITELPAADQAALAPELAAAPQAPLTEVPPPDTNEVSPAQPLAEPPVSAPTQDGLAQNVAQEAAVAETQQLPQTDAGTAEPTLDGDPVAYRGLEVSKTRTKDADGNIVEKYLVQTPENAARKQRGERQIGGDRYAEDMAGARAAADSLLGEAERSTTFDAEIAQQREATETATREATARKAPLDPYAEAQGLNPLQRGAMQKGLGAEVARRDSDAGKVYSGSKHQVIREMLADGVTSEVNEVSAVRDLTRSQFNRLDNRQQADYSEKQRLGGTKKEYYLTNKEGTSWPISKMEYDYAKWVQENPQSQAQTEAVPAAEPEVSPPTPTLATESEALPTTPPTPAPGSKGSLYQQASPDGTTEWFLQRGDAPSDDDASWTTEADAQRNADRFNARQAVSRSESAKSEQQTTLTSTDAAQTTTPKAAAPQAAAAKPAPAADKLTGLFNAHMAAELERMGMPQVEKATTKADADTEKFARERIEREPGLGARLVDELQKKPRSLSDEETLVLLHEVAARKMAVARADKDLQKAAATSTNPFEVTTKQEAAMAARDAYFNATVASKKAGREQGLGLRARRFLLNEDFSLEGLRNAFMTKVTNGKPLSAEQEALIAKYAEEAAPLEAELKAAESLDDMRKDAATAEKNGDTATAEKLKAQAAKIEEQQVMINELTASIQKAQGQAAKDRRSVATRKVIKQRLNADAARERLAAKGLYNLGVTPNGSTDEGTTLYSAIGPDPATIRDYAIIFADKMVDGAFRFSDAVKEGVKIAGKWITPYVERIFRQAKQVYHETAESVFGREAPSAQTILDSIDEAGELTRKDVWDMVRAEIISGTTGDAVLENVTAQIKTKLPDTTHDQVAELFTDYGKSTKASSDPTAKEMARVRLAGRLGLQIRDLLKGQMPKRTGQQRDAPGPAERAKQKKVNDLMRALEAEMREGGVEVPNDEKRLQSALGSLKRRWQNEIEERTAAIEAKAPMVSNERAPVALDEEGVRLRAELEQARAAYEEVFGEKSKEKTYEERVAIAEKALDRSIAEEEQMLKDNILRRPKGTPVNSPGIEAKRAKLEGMRATRRAMAEAREPSNTALIQAKEAAQKAISKYTQMVASGDVSVKDRVSVTPDEELIALHEVRDALKDQVAEMRKALPLLPAQQQAKVAAQIKQLESKIKAVQAKLDNNDLAIPQRAQSATGLDPVVRSLRTELQVLNKELAARRATDPEVRLERYLKAIDSRMNEKIQKIANKDFAPKKRAQVPQGQRAREARAKLALVEREFNGSVLEAKHKALSTPAKLTLLTHAWLSGIPRAVQTSMDVGAGGRQGGLVAYSRPKIALAAFPKNFAFSKAAANAAEIEMRANPNYARFKDLDLDLTSWHPGAKLSEMEEGMQNRLALAIPGIGASVRSYVTYMNHVRFTYAETLVGILEKSGAATEANVKELMHFINAFTGRGNFRGVVGKKIMSGAEASALLLLAPRFWFSRMQVLYNMIYRPLDAATGFTFLGNREVRAARKLIAGEYARMALGMTVWHGFLKGASYLMGATDDDDKDAPVTYSLDPTSSDFMKPKFKNGTRLDFGAGLLQNVVFAARMAKGTKTRADGRSVVADPVKLAFAMLRSKMAPLPSAATDLYLGTDVIGRKVNWETRILQQYTPISVGDVYENFRQLGLGAAAANSLLGLFGFGTNTYGPGVREVSLHEDLIRMTHALELVDKATGTTDFAERRYKSDPPSEGFFGKSPDE